MSDSKQYGGITRDELESLRVDLKNEGVSVPDGDDVILTGPYDIQLHVIYNGSKETLKVSIAKKPFYIPVSMVWNVVDAAVEPYVGP